MESNAFFFRGSYESLPGFVGVSWCFFVVFREDDSATLQGIKQITPKVGIVLKMICFSPGGIC